MPSSTQLTLSMELLGLYQLAETLSSRRDCALPGLVHQLYWLGFCVHSRVWSIGSISWGSVCTPGSGPSALLAGVLCALPGLVHQLYWLRLCVHSRVWSISSIGWGSVCTPGSGPSALLAGVLCALLGQVHQLYWLGFCTICGREF